MSIRTILILILLATILPLPALADEYYVKTKLELVQNVGGVNSWSTPTEILFNLSDSKTYSVATITYYDLGNSNTVAWFKISGGSVTDASLDSTQPTVCIKGTCAMTNGTPSNQGDIRFTLINILKRTTTTTNTFNGSDSPIYAYLYVKDKELALTRNPTCANTANTCTTSLPQGGDTFDATSYFSQETGWSGSKSTAELNVYFKRKSGTAAYTSVIGKMGDTVLRAPRYEEDSEKIKYIIEEPGVYEFTVKYLRTNYWGFSSEEKDIYRLEVKGISATASTNVIAASAPFEVYLPGSKTITMSQKGTFEQQNGITIENVGGNDYKFTPTSTGNFRMKYKGESGAETFVELNAKQSPESAQAPIAVAVTPIIGNQASGDEEGWGTGTFILAGLLVSAVVIGGYTVTRKKKKPRFNPA